MKIRFLYGLMAAFAGPLAYSQVTINEVDADTPSADMAEFIELYNAGATDASLDGHVLVLFNGGDPGEEDDPATPDVDESSPPDKSYLVIDLAGGVIAPGDYFVIGNAAVPNLDQTISNGALQNGTDAVALYNGPTAAAFLAATTPQPPVLTDLLDAVLHSTGDADDTALQTSLGVSEQFDEAANGDKDNESIQRNPDGAATFFVSLATPGTSNDMDPLIDLTLDPAVIGEGDGAGASFGIVVLPSVVTGDLVLSVSIDDGTEVSGPTSVTVPDGDDFVEFELDAVNDNVVDGPQIVEIRVSAAGYQDGVASLTVADDDLVLPDIVINEMQVKASGDDPQFVELYNNQGTAVDIAGWSVKAYASDSAFPSFGDEVGSFTIPSGSPVNLAPGDFYLVGDAIFESVYGITPDLQAEPAFSPFDITMILFDAADNAVYTVLNAADDEDSQANNAGGVAVPDISVSDTVFSAAGYYLDTDGGTSASLIEFTPQPASSATPGQSNSVLIERLRIELDSTFFSESAGVGVATATVTRVNNTAGPLEVTLTSADVSEVVFQSSTLSFADGEESLTVLLDAVDDVETDGIQNVLLTASATGFEDGVATVTVSDDESSSGGSDILFTQYYEGTSNNKHVEITNFADSSITLTGWSLTRWSNAATENWKTATSGAGATIDLSAITIGAGETIVLSNPSAVVPASVTPVLTDGNLNFNGDDSLVLYNGALNPTNIADAISFTDVGNEGGNTSFVRVSLDTGWNTDAGSNITDFPTVWAEVDLATVDAAVTGDTNYLGFFEIGVPSDYSVTVDDCAASGGQFVINFTATGASDVYVSTDLETWGLATNGAGVTSGTYTDAAPPAIKAFYLIQEAGSAAP